MLGLHQAGNDWVARAFVPGAQTLSAIMGDTVPLDCRDVAGFFEGFTKFGIALDPKNINPGKTTSILIDTA